MSWLVTRLKELGKNQAGAARALGIPQQRIREVAKGLRRIQQHEWEPLARYLEWSVADLHAAAGSTDSDSLSAVLGMRPNPQDVTARTLTPPLQSSPRVMPFLPTDEAIPVWWNKQLGAGVLHIERRMVDAVPRFEFLKYAKFSFALEVVADKMAPLFERRDTVVVNPDRAVAPGDDVLLVKGYEENTTAPFEAMLRRLVKETDTHWHVRQFNPAKDYKAAKDEWSRALHVAGKWSR